MEIQLFCRRESTLPCIYRPSQADDLPYDKCSGLKLSALDLDQESQFDPWAGFLYCILEQEAYSHNVSL